LLDFFTIKINQILRMHVINLKMRKLNSKILATKNKMLLKD
jgi:hypothetical protein